MCHYQSGVLLLETMSITTDFKSRMRLPVVAAPMFLISGPELVIECCKQGIIGTFPALNQRSTEGFEEWVVTIKSALRVHEEETGRSVAPFGVNLIVHQSNPRLKADLDICVKHKVPIIITSLGAVPDLVATIHDYGGKVWHDVIHERHGRKAVAADVDGLILVSAGAGGHAGLLNPIPFVHEIRSFFDGQILLSGTLSTGQDIATALQMGADMAYMGTRFINVTESRATAAYQEMIINAGCSDIVYTAAISGVPANFLRSSLEAIGITKEMWHHKAKIDFGKELDAAKAEAQAWKTIWSAGQGVTSIRDVMSVASLVSRLHEEFVVSIERQCKILDQYLK